MKVNCFWVLVLALFVGVGCNSKKPDEKRLESFPVRVEPVAKRNLEDTLTLVGTVKAVDEATLFSRVPGKLLKNLVREGERVEKGAAVALVERDEVGVKFEPAPVPATLSGVVARAYLDRGANVTLTTPIALIVDQRTVLAQADIPERYAGKVSAKQEVRVTVDAFPDKISTGRISRLSPVVDTSTRSTFMEASLENTENLLRSGMFAKLTVVIGKRDGALSIPVEALTDGSNAVFMAENGKAVRREITTGLRTEKHVEVKTGLAEGEKVVVFGLYGLKDGSALEILP